MGNVALADSGLVLLSFLPHSREKIDMCKLHVFCNDGTKPAFLVDSWSVISQSRFQSHTFFYTEYFTSGV